MKNNFTRELLMTKSMNQLRRKCIRRQLRTTRSKLGMVNLILECQEKQVAENQGQGRQHDQVQNVDNQGPMEVQPVDGGEDVVQQVPEAANNARPATDEVSRKRSSADILPPVVGEVVNKRARADADISASAGPNGLMTDTQCRLLLQEVMAAKPVDFEVRREVNRFSVKEAAEEWWPDMNLHKPKLQHEYDAIRDIARASMQAANADTSEQRQHYLAKERKLLTARASTIFCADKEGWNVAQHVAPEPNNFFD